MVLVMALGGSTNAVLHLIAMARAVDVPLTIDDFQRVSDRVPLLADFKPSGKYVMEDLHEVGGTPGRDEDAARRRAARRRLHDRHRQDASPRTSQTCPACQPGQPIVHPLVESDQGDAATSRSCAATSRPRARSPRSPARKGCVSPAPPGSTTPKKTCCTRWSSKEIAKGDVIVIRYEGPKGGPGMPEMLTPTSRDHGRRPGQGRRADHRRPLLRRLARLHRRPRHARSAGRRPDRAGAQTATGSRSTPNRT